MIGFFITSKLRIAREVHFRTVFVSKNAKNCLFWAFFPNTFFLSADSYSHHPSHPSPRVEFSLFFRRTRKDCVFSRGPKPLCRKNPKTLPFLGIFPEDVFPFPAYVFTLCFLARRRLPDERPKKCLFFRVRKNYVFWGAQKCCFFGRPHPCGDFCKGVVE